MTCFLCVFWCLFEWDCVTLRLFQHSKINPGNNYHFKCFQQVLLFFCPTGIGQVVSLGPDCNRTKIGQIVAYLQFGAFAEYLLLSEKVAMPLPGLKVEYLPLMVSGLTAALSLDKV